MGWGRSADKAGKEAEQKCVGPGTVFDIVCVVNRRDYSWQLLLL